MTKAIHINWVTIKCINPDKAVATPNKYRSNDNRKTATRRHNKTVLFRRG